MVCVHTRVHFFGPLSSALCWCCPAGCVGRVSAVVAVLLVRGYLVVGCLAGFLILSWRTFRAKMHISTLKWMISKLLFFFLSFFKCKHLKHWWTYSKGHGCVSKAKQKNPYKVICQNKHDIWSTCQKNYSITFFSEQTRPRPLVWRQLFVFCPSLIKDYLIMLLFLSAFSEFNLKNSLGLKSSVNQSLNQQTVDDLINCQVRRLVSGLLVLLYIICDIKFF